MTDQRHVDINNLLTQLERVSKAATASGHLQTAQTHLSIVKCSLDYEVRILAAKRSKPFKASKNSEEPSPFLPYEQAMYVSHLNTGHVILLNKFNITANHYLIVTPEFEEQKTAIQLKEFRAVAEVLPVCKQLLFYNSGRGAGASQPHRHLQALPVEHLPIDAALTDLPETPAQISMLPYRHLICHLKNPTPETMYQRYQEMISRLDLDNGEPELKPYNLLMTKDWLMVIPRSQGRFATISINSLGFAGLLLMKDQTMYEHLIAAGPDNILNTVTQ